MIFPSEQEAKDRSAVAAADLNCDGINTQHWWGWINLTDGTSALVIQPDGPYGAWHVTATGDSHSLTEDEVAQLVPYSEIEDLIPPPPSMGRERSERRVKSGKH